MKDRQSNIARWAALGIVGYLLLGGLYCVGNVIVRFLGPCPAFAGHDDCHWSKVYELWLFPLSQVASIATGYLLLKFTKHRVSAAEREAAERGAKRY